MRGSRVRDAASIDADVLGGIFQPITATQLAWKLDRSLDRCSNALRQLESRRLARCLNPTASRNRLFWLTHRGIRQQRRHGPEKRITHDYPKIDWSLYSTVCYSQRSEVIKSLSFPMQPSQIKRRAIARTPGRRISANNVRDVIRYLKVCQVVQSLSVRKKAHPLYELTPAGLHMRRLLLQAEVRA